MNDFQPKKSNRNVIILGALVVIVVCICACVGIAGLFGKGITEIITEQPKVESVIDAYMKAMTGHDANKGHALLSTRAQRTVSSTDIETLLEGNNSLLFDDYKSVAVTDFTYTINSDPDPDIPQGQVAEVQGVISYSDGFTRTFTAILEKEGEEWRLYGINIIVSLDQPNP
jgi:hypothetical protein